MFNLFSWLTKWLYSKLYAKEIDTWYIDVHKVSIQIKSNKLNIILNT